MKNFSKEIVVCKLFGNKLFTITTKFCGSSNKKKKEIYTHREVTSATRCYVCAECASDLL